MLLLPLSSSSDFEDLDDFELLSSSSSVFEDLDDFDDLELLSSFDTLLSYKRGEVATKKNRLKIGLDKIISTGELVEGMQKARDAALKLKLNLNS